VVLTSLPDPFHKPNKGINVISKIFKRNIQNRRTLFCRQISPAVFRVQVARRSGNCQSAWLLLKLHNQMDLRQRMFSYRNIQTAMLPLAAK